MNYLLNTSILLHLFRNSPKVEFLKTTISSDSTNIVKISIVSQAELLSIGRQNRWGDRKIKDLIKLIHEFLIIPIDNEEIVMKYAEIDAYSQGKLKHQPLPKGLTARNMGKNDLWIAATASLTNSILVSTDHDFSHLRNTFLSLELID